MGANCHLSFDGSKSRYCWEQPLMIKDIELVLINQNLRIIQLSQSDTPQTLREAIYLMNDQLKPEQMVIINEEMIWNEMKQLKELKSQQKIRLIQRKAQLHEMKSLQINKDIIDEDFKDKSVAKMRCQHYISRNKMNFLFKSQIYNKKNINVQCPIKKQNGSICSATWNQNDMILVAGYTKTDHLKIRNRLVNNIYNRTIQNKFITILLTLFENPQLFQIQWPRQKIAKYLKIHIYDQLSKNLKPQEMALVHNGNLLKNSTQFSSQNLIHITQRKFQVWEIPKLKSNKDLVDQIYGIKGVAYLSQCEHFLSRGAMIQIVKYQVYQLRQNQIYCPNVAANGQICNVRISSEEVKLIAGYCTSEWFQLSEQISKNWVHKNCRFCPFDNCKQPIKLLEQNTKKISCLNCKKIFCNRCSKLWLNINDDLYCGNDGCQHEYTFLQNAEKTRMFNLGGKIVMVPQFRACPRPGCNQIIENTKNCKHTRCLCQNNKYSFCFVCLSIGPPWICGGSFDYCGKVAPNQKISESQTKY